MSTNVRRVTNDVISAVEDGFLSWEEVAKAALSYMSEEEVADMADINDWAIDLDEEDETSNILNRLTEDQLDKIWKIAERYNTSRPVSGNWDTEILHERDAIVKELGLTKEEANEVMVEYLGFDAFDIETAERKFGKKVTAQDVINAAKKYGLTFTEEELKDLEWNIVDYINDSNFNSADEWMKAVVDGETEDVSDMFVQDANWKKVFNESLITKEVCLECGEPLGEDEDQHSDEEDDFVFVSEMRYKDYIIEFFKNKQDRKYYWQASYDGEDRKLGNFNIWITTRGISLYSEDEEGYPTKAAVVAKAKEWVDKQKRRWDESIKIGKSNLLVEDDIEDNVLVKNGYYDDLDFHEAGLLIGDIELQYENLPVIDQFDEDIEVDHTFTVFISPDMVIDFLCAQRGLDRKKLTVTQAQKHIDDLAKNPKDFYQYLKEHFAEEATEEAQYKIAESYKYKAKENFELDDDDDVLGWGKKNN